LTGVVDVGGGLRGIYGAGVLDRCLDEGIAFDYCIGVSAGSANCASYIAGQKGRNYLFYTKYSFRRQYMSFLNLLRTGSYLDMDYIYGELSNKGGENPLDYAKVAASPCRLKVVACNALTGETIYFDKSDFEQDNYDILKGSCSIPVVCRPYIVKGIPCLDGGIADPVPVQKALDDGCEKVVVILTKPRDMLREQKSDLKFAKMLKRKYPAASANLFQRYRRYNDSVALAKQYEKEGRVLIVAPDDIGGMKTLTKDIGALDRMYRKGISDAEAIKDFLR
jgi:predicted patatin/cPLA2 family phospholipase